MNSDPFASLNFEEQMEAIAQKEKERNKKFMKNAMENAIIKLVVFGTFIAIVIVIVIQNEKEKMAQEMVS